MQANELPRESSRDGTTLHGHICGKFGICYERQTHAAFIALIWQSMIQFLNLGGGGGEEEEEEDEEGNGEGGGAAASRRVVTCHEPTAPADDAT